MTMIAGNARGPKGKKKRGKEKGRVRKGLERASDRRKVPPIKAGWGPREGNWEH